MRKNLLLTTALVGVAFAFPAMANEAENPPADTTTTKQEAIYTNETGTTVANGTVFEGLKQEDTQSQNAGAVTVNTQGSIVIGNDVKFLGNNSVAAGGAMKALSGFEIGNNVTFEGNTSEKGGAALYIRQSPNTGATDPVASTTAKIGDDAKFIGNHASDSWHGGAIAVEYAPEGLTIGKNALFEKNSGGHGGAIGLWVSGNDNITDKVASVLKIGDGAQFIGNEAKNIKGENPDGYDSRGGALFINDGAQAELGTATFNLANLKIASEEGAEGFNLVDNALYNYGEIEEDGTLTAEQKSADEVASSLGATGSQAAAIQAALFSEGESNNEAFNGFTEALNSGLQSADKTQVAAAKAATEMLTADANPVVRTVETDIHNMVFSAVSDELNSEGGAIAEGKSSGDTFKQVKAWIRGLFNRADHESTSKASGFDADIYGVAMGIDKQINNAVKLGVGYAYSQADISSGIRDTDVDTHTAILYGQYRPANWYINTVIAYNWSDYDEKKAALGYSADASYDVESLGIQSMYGYETKLGEYDLTPEAGLRYAHISRDGYTDALGTSVASDDSDILTAVVGAKVAKDYTIGCNTIVRPELKAAVTYDLFDDGNNSYVSLANGSAYRVNGEKLDRLGFEFGAKVATEVSDNLEISAGWEGRFREDYQDHTAMLNAKYSF